MVGRLDRQGTGLGRLFWVVDEIGKRPFETRFRLFGALWATEETFVVFLRGTVAWDPQQACVGRGYR